MNRGSGRRYGAGHAEGTRLGQQARCPQDMETKRAMPDERKQRPRASFYTLGCKLNQYDTEALREAFAADGYQIVPFGEPADVCVVNTCTVTGKSDFQSRQALRRAVRSSPTATVAAVGCYAQVAPGTLARIPGVDLVVGTWNRDHVVEWVKSPPDKATAVAEPIPGAWQEEGVSCFGSHTRAFVKIQEGCDARCAFCIVPAARGPSRSRPFADAVEECRALVRRGHCEIVLAGTHLGAYLDGGKRLVDVVEALEEMDGLTRYRLSSIEPQEISGAMIGVLARSAKFCRHLHIPLQSGSDPILRAMGRKYTAAQYEALLGELSERMPQIRLGADVLVGFPGERLEDFEDTHCLVEQSPISHLHVFQYSARAGTRAARMGGQIDPKIKKERSALLRGLGERKARAFVEAHVGRTFRVLVEKRRDRAMGLLTGLTDNYIRVLCEGPDSMMERLVHVRLDRAEGGHALGTVLAGADGYRAHPDD